MDKREHASVDISKLANSLTEEFKTLNPLSQDCCIYRVPQSIRCLNPSDYTPQIVSIGPLHHGKEELKAMEEHKIRYLQHFLENTEVIIGVFLALIKENEAKLRGCYAETIDLESDDFVRMILVDTVFLLEYFLRSCGQSSITCDDRIFRNQGINIWNDLWLVENQLPLFILHDLFDLAKTGMYHNDYQGLTLITITSWFREGVFEYVKIDKKLLVRKFHEAEHFVDLLRLCLQQSQSGAKTEKLQQQSQSSPTQPEFLEVSCAAELHQPVQSWPTEPELKSSSAAPHQPFQSSPTQSEFLETEVSCEAELHQPFLLPTQTESIALKKTSAAELQQSSPLSTRTKFKAEREILLGCAEELHQPSQSSPTQTEFKVQEIPSVTEVRRPFLSSTQTEPLVQEGSIAKELPQPSQSPTQSIPSATELHLAGVKFELELGGDLLHITFEDGILKIPFITVYDDSERFYRNIIAFENIHGDTLYFNDYVIMMSYIANTSKDAELLIQSKIIGLGNAERLSTVFNSLVKGCSLTGNFQYSGLVEKLRSYCDDSPWHKWKATLKQDYFSNPWASISVIAAVVLLVLTIIQTVCSIIAL